jgi:hypothetical protein
MTTTIINPSKSNPVVRPLYVIAREIRSDWRDKNGKPAMYFGAVPYFKAMETLNGIGDSYGCDSAKSIVSYFLANAGTWRGPKAKEIKAELKKIAGIK